MLSDTPDEDEFLDDEDFDMTDAYSDGFEDDKEEEEEAEEASGDEEAGGWWG